MEEKKDNRLIKFITDDGLELELFVVSETKLNGKNYLLVTDTGDSEETNAYILKELASDNKEVAYDLVDNDVELAALGEIFNELLDDVDIVDDAEK